MEKNLVETGEFLDFLMFAKLCEEYGRGDLLDFPGIDISDRDYLFQIIYEVIETVFPEYNGRYEDYSTDSTFCALASPAMQEYMYFANRYGKLNNVSAEANPHFKAMRSFLDQKLGESWLVDYRISLSRRKDRCFLVVYESFEFCQYGALAYRLLEIWKWFEDKWEEIKNGDVLAAQ